MPETPTAAVPLSLAVCALRVTADADGRPAELIRLIPAGRFDAPRGALAGAGPWTLAEAGARRIIARAATRQTDIPIDYEHQILLAADNGRPAPAAGWIDPRSLEWRADGDAPGLYGRVRWTERAAAAIAADEYRYLSPVFPYDPDSGAVLDLLHVALTNTPAIDDDAALRAAARLPSTSTTPETSVDKTKLIELLGLAADASDAQITDTLAALKTRADEAETQLAALKAQPKTPDPAKYVPVETMQQLQTQVAALTDRLNQGEAEQVIEAALAEGKLLPAQREWAAGLAKTDLAALKQYLATAPRVAALTGTQTGGRAPESDDPDALSAAELAVAKSMGLSADAYRAAKGDA